MADSIRKCVSKLCFETIHRGTIRDIAWGCFTLVLSVTIQRNDFSSCDSRPFCEDSRHFAKERGLGQRLRINDRSVHCEQIPLLVWDIQGALSAKISQIFLPSFVGLKPRFFSNSSR